MLCDARKITCSSIQFNNENYSHDNNKGTNNPPTLETAPHAYLELNGDGTAMPRHIRHIRHKLCCMQALVAVGLRLHDIVFEAKLGPRVKPLDHRHRLFGTMNRSIGDDQEQYENSLL